MTAKYTNDSITYEITEIISVTYTGKALSFVYRDKDGEICNGLYTADSMTENGFITITR